MNVRDELVERCARRRDQKLGGLSPQAFDELLIAVRNDVGSFVEAPEDQAFATVGRAIAAYQRSVDEDEYLDDDQFYEARDRRLNRIRSDCDTALALDPSCIDAQTIKILARPEAPGASPQLAELVQDTPVGSWDDVFSRPALRARAALSRALLADVRLKAARAECEAMLEADPQDHLGCRHTLALVLARLEDERSFGELDARYGQNAGAWEHLARVILMYKLGREGATRRALHGYDSLVQGGAYALLRPVLAEPYLPDRPESPRNGFGEAVMAVNEAEAIVVDTPGLILWCQNENWFVRSAARFADESGFDWDD